jgi:hypothetical protein
MICACDPEHSVEGGDELAVVVVNEEVDRGLSCFKLPDHLSCLLCDPLGVGMGCTSCA